MADQAVDGPLSLYRCPGHVAAAHLLFQDRIPDVRCGPRAQVDIEPSGKYLRVELDVQALIQARRRHPQHPFQSGPLTQHQQKVS